MEGQKIDVRGIKRKKNLTKRGGEKMRINGANWKAEVEIEIGGGSWWVCWIFGNSNDRVTEQLVIARFRPRALSFLFFFIAYKKRGNKKKKKEREISYVLKIEKKKQGLNEKIERSMTNELGIWENKEKETNRNTILSATYTE